MGMEDDATRPWHEEAVWVAEFLESKEPNSIDEHAEGCAALLRAALAERAELLAEVERLRAFLLDLGSTRHALAPCATGDGPCPHGSASCTVAGAANAALKR